MFFYDAPAVSLADTVLMAQVEQPNSAQSPKVQAITLNQLWIVPSDPQYAYSPGRFAADLAPEACGELLQFLKFKPLRWTSPTCKFIGIVTQPKHGVLVDEGNGAYGFKPAPGYLGKDSIQYIVEGVDGRRVLVTMPVLLKTVAAAFAFNQLMPVEQTNVFTAWQKQSELSALLASASGVVYLTSDLPGNDVGNIVGEGANAAITLDTAAAGHGWCVDSTPLDNTDDYLPTTPRAPNPSVPLGTLLIGYKGEEIPLVGRIVAVADVFDALITARPYKRAFSVEETMEYMTTQSGRHFEPRLIDALVAILPEILKIQAMYADELGTVHELEPGRS